MRKFVHESRAKHLVFRMFLLAQVDHSLLLVRFVVLSLCGILFNYYLVYFSIIIWYTFQLLFTAILTRFLVFRDYKDTQIL